MSNRSMLEFNHDYYPNGKKEEEWFFQSILRYMRSGNAVDLPQGVTWFGMRHHSDPCPLGKPPRGWLNNESKVRLNPCSNPFQMGDLLSRGWWTDKSEEK